MNQHQYNDRIFLKCDTDGRYYVEHDGEKASYPTNESDAYNPFMAVNWFVGTISAFMHNQVMEYIKETGRNKDWGCANNMSCEECVSKELYIPPEAGCPRKWEWRAKP